MGCGSLEVVDPLFILIHHGVSARSLKPSRARSTFTVMPCKPQSSASAMAICFHAPAAGTVGRETRITGDAGHAADQDDAAILRGDHQFPRGPAARERKNEPRRFGVEDQVSSRPKVNVPRRSLRTLQPALHTRMSSFSVVRFSRPAPRAG